MWHLCRLYLTQLNKTRVHISHISQKRVLIMESFTHSSQLTMLMDQIQHVIAFQSLNKISMSDLWILFVLSVCFTVLLQLVLTSSKPKTTFQTINYAIPNYYLQYICWERFVCHHVGFRKWRKKRAILKCMHWTCNTICNGKIRP